MAAQAYQFLRNVSVIDDDDIYIPTKARPIQMNAETVEFCKREISDLLEKKLIRNSKSPWSCSAFYVQKNAEIERGTPRLVINYKPLNKVLEWIRYPIQKVHLALFQKMKKKLFLINILILTLFLLFLLKRF